jgi:hypothetical protein
MDSNDNLVLVWQATWEDGSDLFYSLYDSRTNSWLLEEQLTQSENVEKQISVRFDGSGQLMIAYALDNVTPETIISEGVTINNVMQYQSTDLHVLHYTPDSDLTVENLALPYRPNPEPGETVLLRASIVNSGDWSIENPTISFFDGDPSAGGVLIDTYTHAGFITAGERIEVDVEWPVPAVVSAPKTIFAVVDPDGLIDERDETNNQATLTTIMPDLKVSSVSSYYYDQETVVPLAVIYNNGKLNAENVLVEFREGAVDGPVIYSEVIPLIEKEDMVAVSTELSVAGWASGTYKYYVTIDSADSILEFDEENNTGVFTLSILPDLVIYAGDISTSIVDETGGSVDVTVRNWGTTGATNVEVSLYEGPDIDLSRTPLHTWTVPSLAVDEVLTLSTTVDHVPNHLFAVIDPSNAVEELDEDNNVGYEQLPVVHGLPVSVAGSSDPNLADIIALESEFDSNTGVFSYAVQAMLFDASILTDTNGLCDISTLIDYTEMQGKIVLVEKSAACDYDVQVNNAASMGAVAVLVYNTSSASDLREVMTGAEVFIPAASLAHQDGLDLLPLAGQEVAIPSDTGAITILDPYQ